MGKACTLLFLCLLAGSLACRGGAGPSGSAGAPPPQAADPDPSPPPPDAPFEGLFARIAGLPEPARSAWQDEACWIAYENQAAEAWAHFETAVLRGMTAWAGTELREARTATTTLLYPFGGPDLVTASRLFPDAAATVLLGLEPVGNLPDLDAVTAEWRAAFFADLGGLVSGFLLRGYFITREMNEVYSRGKVDGALPVIAFFLGRTGYAVAGVESLEPGQGGDWVARPYARTNTRPRRPNGVRIDYRRPGEAALRAVYYFSCDVENKAFGPDSALFRLLAGLERVTTFVKSGSYLLHWDSFSTLRRLILDRSLFVLQDDTAIPYRHFVDQGWEVRLFGRYATPVRDFTNVEQPDLRRAYEEAASSVPSLPFHFGYRWRSELDNLLLARRPRAAYKTPVLR